MTAAAPVELGVARAVAEGETVAGDEHVAVACRDGMLLAAIDGLGHGAAAAVAAQRAAEVLRAHPDEPLPQLVERCHAALAETRGATLTVARVDARAGTLTWLGVGNVEGRLLRAGGEGDRPPRVDAVLLLGGVVGHQLPPLRPLTVPLGAGDTVVLATDGIDVARSAGARARGALGPLAEGLLRRGRRGADDALVLLARIAG